MIGLFPSKIPFFMPWVFPGLMYRRATNQKQIYLTFDDGPTPEITPWVLDVLEREQVKATFFCVGSQIEKYPDIFKQILEAEHQIGNHSYVHEKGWQIPAHLYKESIDKTEQLIVKHTYSSKLFRPPYGRVTPKQIKLLKQARYEIVMWSLLTGDFSVKLNPEQALAYLIQKSHPGDIVVFHDSRKAFNNLKIILPEYIRQLKKRQFKFATL